MVRLIFSAKLLLCLLGGFRLKSSAVLISRKLLQEREKGKKVREREREKEKER